MNEGITSINNNYTSNQFYYHNDKNTNKRTIYSLQNVNTIEILDKSIVIKMRYLNPKNDLSIVEVFDNKEKAEDYFFYILTSLTEGDRLIGKEIFEKLKSK